MLDARILLTCRAEEECIRRKDSEDLVFRKNVYLSSQTYFTVPTTAIGSDIQYIDLCIIFDCITGERANYVNTPNVIAMCGLPARYFRV